jgi:hypothetical protein
MSFPPTAEQQAIIDAAKTGKNGVIEAGAGTGKTSTLRLIGKALAPAKGLYLAYNRAIKDEADGTFPSNMKCQTAHSVAYGYMMNRHANGKALMARLNEPCPAFKIAKALGVPSQGFSSGDFSLKQSAAAFAAKQAVIRWTLSDDPELSRRHVEYLGKEVDPNVQADFEVFVLGFARKLWADWSSPSGRIGWGKTHDIYVKLWALSNPKLNYGFILFDEAQDAWPAISGVVKQQSCQVIMVGDSCQQIYAWRGAENALANFEGFRLNLSQSFRFGPAIAERANHFLEMLEAPLRLSGFEKINSTIEPLSEPAAILCRTNAGVIEYALDAQQAGRQVYIEGGTKEIESFAKGAEKLMNGSNTENEYLINFKSWDEVVIFSQTDEGRDIRLLVRLVENYGTATILAVCDSTVKEADADLTVSTAHKSKGREWSTVKIGRDFKPNDEGKISPSEAMLMYVAVTRAQITLDDSALAWVYQASE